MECTKHLPQSRVMKHCKTRLSLLSEFQMTSSQKECEDNTTIGNQQLFEADHGYPCTNLEGISTTMTDNASGTRKNAVFENAVAGYVIFQQNWMIFTRFLVWILKPKIFRTSLHFFTGYPRVSLVP